MTHSKADLFDRARDAGTKAPLKQAEPTNEQPRKAGRPAMPSGYRRKAIGLPGELFDRFDKLKETGKTTLSFSGFIAEALREKLDKME